MDNGFGFFLGIDAAAHGTTAALADEQGIVRAGAVGPGVTPATASAPHYQRFVHAIVDEVLERASLPRTCLSAVAIGISGAETSSAQRRMASWIQPTVAPARFHIECPAILSLRAATRDAVGVSLVADHRTSCVGRDRYGRRHSVGGHGAISGDVGYAQDLAMRALGGAWMAEDGRAGPSSLSTAIPEAVGVGSVQRLPEVLERGELPSSVVETAVACLFEQADAGDGLAEKIVEDTGMRLGSSAIATLRALSLNAHNAVVVLDGAMFTRPSQARLVHATQQRILSAVNEAHVITARTPRVIGAILFARDLMDHAPLAFADRVRRQASTLDDSFGGHA